MKKAVLTLIFIFTLAGSGTCYASMNNHGIDGEHINPASHATVEIENVQNCHGGECVDTMITCCEKTSSEKDTYRRQNSQSPIGKKSVTGNSRDVMSSSEQGLRNFPRKKYLPSNNSNASPILTGIVLKKE